MDVPEIHYTRSGDVAIAYQVVGEGTFDLVFVPTFANLVFPWLNREWKSFYERLASFARLIMLDKRERASRTDRAISEVSRYAWTTSVRFSTQLELSVRSSSGVAPVVNPVRCSRRPIRNARGRSSS